MITNNNNNNKFNIKTNKNIYSKQKQQQKQTTKNKFKIELVLVAINMSANHLKFSSTSALLMVPSQLARVVRAATVTECNNSTCDPIDEYCSQFDQACMPCSRVCDEQDVRYEKDVCSQQCSSKLINLNTFVVVSSYIKKLT